MTLHDIIGHSGVDDRPHQTLYEHLRNVAELAGTFADSFGSRPAAEWLGWWHDAGKCAEDVQAYLRGETGAKQGPDHSSVGMLEASTVLPPLAFNVAGHHGGLGDQESLRDRIVRKKAEDRIIQAWTQAQALLQACILPNQSNLLPAFFTHPDPSERRRRTVFWMRMLHAALVDADCLDTEAHFQPDKQACRDGGVPLEALWERFADRQAALLSRARGEVNEVRRAVYEACLAAAELTPGLFALTVPTGGGKTRSAMGFALRHAIRYRKRRIIVALPYTSIIEQNTDVYRELFGAHVVLEHHSSASGREKPGEASEDERWARLAAENWDAPIVVTTTVQLLESLFAHRNSRIRKLHRIAGSVIILDEVQTLPPHLLKATLAALEHLVEAYGVTLVLCTATQPALQARPGFPGLTGLREIVPDPAHVFDRLRRVRYEIMEEPWSWARVADEIRGAEQAMVVLNTIRDAMSMLDELKSRSVLHLSTLLCGAHRRQVLQHVRKRLARNRPVHLVSTQVVEAGVDLDFPLVLRALGPLDRIIQAAGRCNREGRLGAGRVVVFTPEDGHLPPGAYQTGTNVTRTLLASRPDLDDPALAVRYFRMLYDVLRAELDDRNVVEKWTRFQFEQVGRAYRLIDDDTVPVVVPYVSPKHPHARERVLDRIERQSKPLREDYRALQPYLVSLRTSVHEEAMQKGLCEAFAPDVWIWTGVYDDLRGLQVEMPVLKDPVV